jgi:hypothetical protein
VALSSDRGSTPLASTNNQRIGVITMNENILGQSRTFPDMKLTVVGFIDDYSTDWGTLAIVRVDILDKNKSITATHTIQMNEGELADAGFTLYI